VGGEAVANRWAVRRWTVVGGIQKGDHWLPATDYRSPATGYGLTDHRSAGESVLGRTEGGRRTKGGQQGPGNDSPATPNRGRLDRTAESAANRKGSACCTLRAQSPSLSPRGIPRRNPQQADPFVHPALTGATRPSYTRPMAARYGDWSPRLGSLAGRRPRRLWTP
jgi:hypothetical protein